MTSALRQLALFALGLAALFAVGLAAGGALDAGARGEDGEGAEPRAGAQSAAHVEDAHGPSQQPAEPHASPPATDAATEIRGLAVADRGLRLVVDDPELHRARRQTLRFRIVGAGGETVRDFDVEHTKRMHLIVVRRDLTGFQHLHPTLRADGTWTTPLRLDEAGAYRLFADFSHAGRASTLAGDLRVDGAADLRALPAVATRALSDGGHAVRLQAGRVRPGEEALLRFTATSDGRPVHPEPFLGAKGHLVALREGDLAFLHVHPVDGAHAAPGTTGREHDDAVAFATTFPTAGRYRLFLQLRIAGRVDTVAFTQEVSGP